MAPVIVDPSRIKEFATEKTFETWLSKQHEKEAELWLRLYKKDSGVRSVTRDQAVDVALCWGWIDGLRKSYDALSFLQRFTPRKANSIWSDINRVNVARLIQDERMTPHGLRHVEAAKANGRWDTAYKRARDTTMPEDLMRAINADKKALATFAKLDKQNLFSLSFRLGNLKTAAGREKKIAAFVEMLRRGEAIHPSKSEARPNAKR